jgi:hypothetical protein
LSSHYALANSQWLELFEFTIWNSDQLPLLGLLVAVAHMPAQHHDGITTGRNMIYIYQGILTHNPPDLLMHEGKAAVVALYAIQ